MTAPEVAVHGTVEPGFEGVLAAFEENFATHGDVGASVAVTIGGRMVVDLWGGTASFDGPDDDEAGVPGVEGDWQQDTIINVMSTTKTMAALVCLMLADRGELDLYEPIASYWPEFAANGKDRIATRHVLSHTAGLAGWDEPLDETDFFDHDKLVGLLAAQAPWWEPGTQSGYHADTQGYLLGEIVKRVDGRTLGTFFAEEVAGPLDADFHIGTPAECDPRIARLIGSGPIEAGDDPTSIPYRTFNNPPYLRALVAQGLASRRDPRRRWSRQRPLRGVVPRADRLRWHCQWSDPAVRGWRRPYLRCAVRGTRLEPARAAHVRHGFRPLSRVGAVHPRVRLGRVGRLAGDRQRGCPDEFRLRDEPNDD